MTISPKDSKAVATHPFPRPRCRNIHCSANPPPCSRCPMLTERRTSSNRERKINPLLCFSTPKPVRALVYRLFPGVLPWSSHRYLRLHERSVRISRCARWCVALRHDVDDRDRDLVTNPFTENVDFKDSGITVVGISADPVPAIKAFVAKHGVTVGARITKRFPSRLGLTTKFSIRC